MNEELSVNNLNKGKSYLFRVCAFNRFGKSKFVELQEEVVAEDPVELPDQPINIIHSNVTKDSVTLTWTPPAFDGGSKITG